MSNKKTYTVTLVDAVHYNADIDAENAQAAKTKARQLWDDDFLRFTPVDDGSIEILSVRSLQRTTANTAGGSR